MIEILLINRVSFPLLNAKQNTKDVWYCHNKYLQIKILTRAVLNIESFHIVLYMQVVTCRSCTVTVLCLTESKAALRLMLWGLFNSPFSFSHYHLRKYCAICSIVSLDILHDCLTCSLVVPVQLHSKAHFFPAELLQHISSAGLMSAGH